MECSGKSGWDGRWSSSGRERPAPSPRRTCWRARSPAPRGWSSAPGPAGLAWCGPDRYVRDPWAPGALAGVRAAGGVLLLGTGLTAVDIVLTLHRRDPAAVVSAVSRRGLLPQAHTASTGPALAFPVPGGDLTLRRLHAALR